MLQCDWVVAVIRPSIIEPVSRIVRARRWLLPRAPDFCQDADSRCPDSWNPNFRKHLFDLFCLFTDFFEEMKKNNNKMRKFMDFNSVFILLA